MKTFLAFLIVATLLATNAFATDAELQFQRLGDNELYYAGLADAELGSINGLLPLIVAGTLIMMTGLFIVMFTFIIITDNKKKRLLPEGPEVQ